MHEAVFLKNTGEELGLNDDLAQNIYREITETVEPSYNTFTSLYCIKSVMSRPHPYEKPSGVSSKGNSKLGDFTGNSSS